MAAAAMMPIVSLMSVVSLVSIVPTAEMITPFFIIVAGRRSSAQRDQGATTCLYMCHVVCPKIGMTTANPTNSGIQPKNSEIATMKPHNNMVMGLTKNAFIEV